MGDKREIAALPSVARDDWLTQGLAEIWRMSQNFPNSCLILRNE
jgi:hypothetical protein